MTKSWTSNLMFLGLALCGGFAVAAPKASAGCAATLTASQVKLQSEARAQAFESELNQIELSLKDPKLGVFGPQSVMWKIFRERALLVGLARMGIMQMANPRVSEIVLSSAKFRTQPIVRMENTVSFLKTLVYGDWKSARKMSNAIFQIHQRVQNEHVVGTKELDDLMLWVHASTWDSILLAYETLVGKLTPQEVDQFYAETKTFGALLGLPRSAIPKNYQEFRSYVDFKSSSLILSTETKAYIQEILGNNDILKQVLPERWPIDLDLTRKATVSGAVFLLPEGIKNQMAVENQSWMNSILRVGFSLSPYLMPLLPARLRYSRAYLAAVSEVPNADGVEKPKCPFHDFF